MVATNKRQKFIFASILLGLQLLSLRFFFPGWQYRSAILVAIFSALVILISLREDLTLLTTLLLPILPAAFAGGSTLFSFLLPKERLIMIIFSILFSLSMYAIFLTENVFGVAAIRTIQLVRAAHAVGFLYTILAALILYNVTLSFHRGALANGLFISLISLPLVIHSLWVIKLEPKITWEVVLRSLGIVLVLAELGFTLSFLPVATTLAALFLAAVLYAGIGLMELDFLKNLKPRSLIEYLGVVALLFLVIIWQSLGRS